VKIFDAGLVDQRRTGDLGYIPGDSTAVIFRDFSLSFTSPRQAGVALIPTLLAEPALRNEATAEVARLMALVAQEVVTLQRGLREHKKNGAKRLA
jgi:hypothetical protein